MDYGGVRREWFELLCKELFHPDFGLFVQAEDGSEAVHPNPGTKLPLNLVLCPRAANGPRVGFKVSW